MYKEKIPKAFTLIELLVVIAIIGVLSTLVIVALGNSRAGARDAKRLNDLKAMANALELYYADNNSYPQANNFSPGQPLEAGGIVYMNKIPNNPTPRNDGDCPNNDYLYGVFSGGQKYVIYSCLGSTSTSLPSNMVVASPDGVGASYLLSLTNQISDAAFSLRQLSPSYSGPVIRLRRSDNSQQDFYFKNNYLDIDSIKSWNTGGGDLYVVTWYDQSGNAWNLTQNTAADQLKFNVDGKYIYDANSGSTPGTATNFSSSVKSFGSINNLQIFAVEYLKNNVGVPSTFGLTSNDFRVRQLYGGGGTTRRLWTFISGVQTSGSNYGRNAVWDLITWNMNTTTSKIQWNGNTLNESFGVVGSYSGNINTTWGIFKWSDTDIRIRELVYFINKDMDEDTVNMLRHNQNAYFTIY